MALYSLKKISILAESRQAYLRGIGGYNAGWVRDLSVATDTYYTQRVTAQVQEPSVTYQVEVGFDREEPVHLACGCSRYRATHKACKHIVAALVYKYYQDMSGTPTDGPTVASAKAGDPVVSRLIDRHLSTQRIRLTAREETAAPVVLTPRLHLTGQRPTLSFTVGRDKPYLIKNVSRFVGWMERGETVEYGRELTLLHHRQSFAPESRPLLDFLLTEMGDTPQQIGTVPSTGVGEMPLTAGGLDRFVALMMGSRLSVITPEGEHRVTLADDHPTLTLTAKQEGEGLRLYGDEAMPLCGAGTLYLLCRGCLYRTGREYAQRMTEWVRATYRNTDGLYVSADQMNGFRGMLTGMRPYLRMQGDTAALESYATPSPEPEVYLDRLPDGTVTARVTFTYGGRSVGYDTPTAPWQDALAELPVRLLLDRYFSGRLDDHTLIGRWEDDTRFAFLSQGLPRLEQLATVTRSVAFDKNGLATAPRVTWGVSLMEDLLEMDIGLEDLDPAELVGIMQGYRENRAFHTLADGRLLPLTEGDLSRLVELTEGLNLSPEDLNQTIRLPRYRALYLEQVLRQQNIPLQRDRLFDRLVERHNRATEADYEVPDMLQATLRGYQRAGYRWLRTMEELGFGGILADEMGLGKTLQMITLFVAAKERGVTAPSLVVCPTSVVLGWEQEIHKFAPQLSVLCVVGDAAERQRRLALTEDYDVVVTSYDILKRDVALYEGLTFHYHVLDEAQYIKNSTTQNARAVKTVRSAQRFALTGTPVENRLSELWSIFDFLMPGFLFSAARFRTHFEQPIQKQQDMRTLHRLGQMVSPFILRRLKQQVLTELPPKTERVLPADMERPQRQVYLSAIADLRRQLTGAGKLTGRQRITVLSHLTRLRQICCDPRLCCEGYVGESGKLDACLELLSEASAGGHKVLLFSQFTSMLSLIEQRLKAEGIPYYLLKGSTPKEERARLVNEFNRDDTPVFLISLKAGGVGLNLTGADMVIHYDPWWNLAVENQATDRAHRIGQKNPVQVVRLIARDTIEEKILQMQERKWQLAQQVVGQQTPSITDLTVEELLELLE